MAIWLIMLAIFTIEGLNFFLVIIMIVYLASFQMTFGTYYWVYVLTVTCEEALSMATGANWGSVVLVSLLTPKLMDTI